MAHLARELTGRSIVQTIHEVRVSHAQRLLAQTGKTCTEIAYEVGFCDQSYFIKQFRSVTGVTPARYRRAHRAGDERPGGKPMTNDQ